MKKLWLKFQTFWMLAGPKIAIRFLAAIAVMTLGIVAGSSGSFIVMGIFLIALIVWLFI